MFAVHRHHAFITNSTLDIVTADQTHRDHAIVEQVIAELKDGPLAHLPSGKYAANAAWLALTAASPEKPFAPPPGEGLFCAPAETGCKNPGMRSDSSGHERHCRRQPRQLRRQPRRL